jgi:OOP family OmpA-OmpF porin
VGTVVLLPEKEGREASVVVRSDPANLVLAQPYAAADLTTAGAFGYVSSADEVRALFGAALAAQPDRPMQFTLYFLEGSEELTDDSRKIFETALAEIGQRPVPDIVVIGHADLVGSAAFNDALARKRAESVRTALIGRGFAPDAIEAVSRGKREPAIPTRDGVAEPRNRRVEIIVR